MAETTGYKWRYQMKKTELRYWNSTKEFQDIIDPTGHHIIKEAFVLYYGTPDTEQERATIYVVFKDGEDSIMWTLWFNHHRFLRRSTKRKITWSIYTPKYLSREQKRKLESLTMKLKRLQNLDS